MELYGEGSSLSGHQAGAECAAGDGLFLSQNSPVGPETEGSGSSTVDGPTAALIVLDETWIYNLAGFCF